jgi:peroxiredoxin
MEQILAITLILLWIIVIINLTLTLAIVRQMSARIRPKKGLKEGQAAPNFTAETLSGDIVTLATYANREVVFLFIDSMCGPCREALPGYEALGPKAGLWGVDLVLVSVSDVQLTRNLAEEFNIKLPILVAPRTNNPFAEDYKITSTPSYCFINRQSKVISTGLPNIQWDKWKELVKRWEDHLADNATLLINERR